MNRVGNLFEEVISVENLKLADIKARRGKTGNLFIKEHDKNREQNILRLHETLKQGQYKTSNYTVFTLYEGKKREIYKLPYYPDRIVHHALMNKLEDIFVSCFTADTYSCIKGRGIHKASYNLRNALKDQPNTLHCLKIDILKFYPNIHHGILKKLLRRKFKDLKLLSLLDEIIDSADGVPIGNYLSQYFANFYLTSFDHWIKEVKKVKYYFRYCDDIVILGNSKKYLWKLFADISSFLRDSLRLEIKSNYQVFPVESRGIDFVGYVHYHDYTLLRKSIKNRFIYMLKHNKNYNSIASYYGWITHCNSLTLQKKYLYEYT